METPITPDVAAPSTSDDTPPTTQPVDPRQQYEAACAEAMRLRDGAQEAALALRDARRALAAARQSLEETLGAGDNRAIAERKSAARKAYRQAVASALSEVDRQRAVTVWLREIDVINRGTRYATGSLVGSRAKVIELQIAADAAERVANTERIRAESAAAACTEARRRLVGAEEPAPAHRLRLRTGAGGARSTVVESSSDGDRLVVMVPVAPDPEQAPTSSGPLVIERLLDGDRDTLRLLARVMSEFTGAMPSRYLLLLQELVDGLQARAADAGSLSFDHQHPFWSHFSPEEARTVARALRDLGFRFDPREGWYGDRAPASSDLALALAYAGFDVRGMRRLPTADDLRSLPASVAVATLEFVAGGASDLAVDQVMRLMGPGADRLSDLWDDWAHLRPLLLETAVPITA